MKLEGTVISDDAGADANIDAQSLKELPNTRSLVRFPFNAWQINS